MQSSLDLRKSHSKETVIRKAQVTDVPRLAELINGYASQGEMLPKSMNQLYQNIRDFVVAEIGEQVVGCAALHVLWEDLAEIRSLAVEPSRRGNGLGRKLVLRLLEEARALGLPVVFALTYRPGFFASLGFHEVDKESLPRKIWVDCIDCVHFPECNETAMVYELGNREIGA